MVNQLLAATMHTEKMKSNYVGIIKTAREAILCKSPNHVKTSLLNYIYSIRSKLIQKLIFSTIDSINSNKNLNTNSIQLLVLGSGLDLSYDLYPVNHIYLVDFHEVIVQRIEATIIHTTSNIRYISGDLREFGILWRNLLSNGLDINMPTIIVCECVLCYIDLLNMNNILSTLSLHLQISVLISYDPIISQVNTTAQHTLDYINMMYNKFQERNAPLLYNIHSKSQYISNLYNTGWKHVLLCNINNAVKCILSEHERKLLYTNEFDEYGSLALLHNLYVIVITSTHSLLFQEIYSKLITHKTNTSSSLIDNQNNNQDMLNNIQLRISYLELRLHSLLSNNINKNELSNIKSSASISYNGNLVSHTLTSNNNNRNSNKSITTISINSLNLFFKSLLQQSFNNINLRKAEINDIQNLMIIYKLSFDSLSNIYKSVNKYIKYSIKSLENLYKTYPVVSESILIIAEKNNEIIGCIGVKVYILLYNN